MKESGSISNAAHPEQGGVSLALMRPKMLELADGVFGDGGRTREDTALFPALRTILPPKQVESLGDRMEEDEHRVLGIYNLARFTAKG